MKKDLFFLIPVIFSLVSIVIIISLFGFFLSKLPSNLPLFYSMSWGEDILVAKQQFFIIPLILFLITLVNIAIAWQLHTHQVILRRILLTSIIAIDIILTITTIKVLTIFI